MVVINGPVVQPWKLVWGVPTWYKPSKTKSRSTRPLAAPGTWLGTAVLRRAADKQCKYQLCQKYNVLYTYVGKILYNLLVIPINVHFINI